MMDDDEGYPPEGGCLGTGSAHAVSERAVRNVKKNPIGFIHFPDKPEPRAKAKRAVKTKAKRRKR